MIDLIIFNGKDEGHEDFSGHVFIDKYTFFPRVGFRGSCRNAQKT
jgi:hypothetical protein